MASGLLNLYSLPFMILVNIGVCNKAVNKTGRLIARKSSGQWNKVGRDIDDGRFIDEEFFHLLPQQFRLKQGSIGSAYGIRTRDLVLERDAS